MVEINRIYISPEEWERARDLQNTYDDVSETQAEEIAHRLASECRESGWVKEDGNPDIRGHVTDLAANNPVEPSTEGKPFAFWSYESAPDSYTQPVSHRFLAQACAESRGYEVLETTPTGNRMDSYRLFNKEVIDKLDNTYEIDETEVKATRKEAWSVLSRSYTQAARGEVQVFAADVHKDSVLGKDELPELLANEEVGKEQIRFAVEMPRHEHLPEDMDRFIANDAVRAQVTMGYYSENGPSLEERAEKGIPADSSPPRVLADKLDQIDTPPELQEKRDEVVERLRGVSSYTELARTNRELAREHTAVESERQLTTKEGEEALEDSHRESIQEEVRQKERSSSHDGQEFRESHSYREVSSTEARDSYSHTPGEADVEETPNHHDGASSSDEKVPVPNDPEHAEPTDTTKDSTHHPEQATSPEVHEPSRDEPSTFVAEHDRGTDDHKTDHDMDQGTSADRSEPSPRQDAQERVDDARDSPTTEDGPRPEHEHTEREASEAPSQEQPEKDEQHPQHVRAEQDRRSTEDAEHTVDTAERVREVRQARQERNETAEDTGGEREDPQRDPER